MVNVVLQVICSFLFAAGLLFILVELRSKFERAFLHGGIFVCLLCALTAVDIWFIPGAETLQETLYWVRVYHILFTVMLPFLLWHIMILTKSNSGSLMRIVVLMILLMTPLLLTDWMLHAANNEIKTTSLYYITYVPFALFVATSFLWHIIRRFRRADAPERRILRFHLIGFSLLILASTADLLIVATIGISKLAIKSFTVLGVLAYGIMISLVFAERLFMLIIDRNKAYEKLEAAYKDLEAVNALKQLGESTAIINHEIKNYMFMIGGLAELIEKREPLTADGKKRIGDLKDSVYRLTKFSQDILGLSRSQIVKDKERIDLSGLLESCIARNFPNKKEHFHLAKPGQPHFIYGDWGKLEQAFVNLFGNAIEAASANEPLRIDVRIRSGEGVLLLIIEDNGIGCTREQLKHFFSAFFTTKKGSKGTGLGLSITRTIIEGHGGRISAYTKNLPDSKDHGLSFQIAFPLYADEEEKQERKAQIVLVKEDLPALETVIRIFQNLHVSPHVVQTHEEIDAGWSNAGELNVLSSPQYAAKVQWKRRGPGRIFLLSEHSGLVYVMEEPGNGNPEIFCEEFVLGKLCIPSHSQA